MPSTNLLASFLLAALVAAVFLGSPPESAENDSAKRKQRVYFGTYTRGTESKGIYVADVESLTDGKFGEARLAGECENPSFLVIHPDKQFLYAVCGVADYKGTKSGSVAAFKINPADGKLTMLNQQPSNGGAPCHLVVDQTGKSVLTANYTGGSVCVHPIEPDGKLGAATSFVQHQGKSVNARRQEAPHAHSINLDPANRFAFVADLGLDQVLSYYFDAERRTLAANPSGNARLKPGAGPRHFAFRPDGKFACVCNELHSTVTSFKYNAERGSLEEVNTVSTLPADTAGNSTAECQVHPNGKFVYVSNRGHDSIAIFAMDNDSGRLSFIGTESTQGKTPRNFCIDPTGSLLLAENQGSNSVVVFHIDGDSGKLSATGTTIQVPTPVCAKFWHAEN